MAVKDQLNEECDNATRMLGRKVRLYFIDILCKYAKAWLFTYFYLGIKNLNIL